MSPASFVSVLRATSFTSLSDPLNRDRRLEGSYLRTLSAGNFTEYRYGAAMDIERYCMVSSIWVGPRPSD